ncbi:hypothetical protein KBC85_02530 [Candidatus Saccharibacteria bacterium]|nr:hypothetical protein [Candidatus Saccharibacteria bacterium]
MKIDNDLLAELGLAALSEDEKKALIEQIIETLEMRVGTVLASGLTDAQLQEFEGFMNANDQAGALKWLETNAPNYKQVVKDELEKLKGEVKTNAPQILAASASQQGQVGQGQQQPPASA